MITNTNFKIRVTLLLSFCMLLYSCGKFLPEERQNIGSDALFNQTTFQPVLGRTTQYGDIFYAGSTTFPVEFKIINPLRVSTGETATELTDIYPVTVWTEAYTGDETS
ncbi:MAG: DUF5007 domain-containing protein, partial [Niabella sp.]